MPGREVPLVGLGGDPPVTRGSCACNHDLVRRKGYIAPVVPSHRGQPKEAFQYSAVGRLFYRWCLRCRWRQRRIQACRLPRDRRGRPGRVECRRGGGRGRRRAGGAAAGSRRGRGGGGTGGWLSVCRRDSTAASVPSVAAVTVMAVRHRWLTTPRSTMPPSPSAARPTMTTRQPLRPPPWSKRGFCGGGAVPKPAGGRTLMVPVLDRRGGDELVQQYLPSRAVAELVDHAVTGWSRT